jgi:hypothetical protein
MTVSVQVMWFAINIAGRMWCWAVTIQVQAAMATTTAAMLADIAFAADHRTFAPSGPLVNE